MATKERKISGKGFHRKGRPPERFKKLLRKLQMINAAQSEKDLMIPPNNRFEHLKGRWKGWCSIRVNDQWRVVFKWKAGDAYEVQLIDYH